MSGILTNVSPIAVKALNTTLFNDPLLTKNAVFRRFIGNNPNPTTGKNVVNYEDTQVLLVEMKHTEQSVKSASAKVELGQKVLLIRFNDLTITPTTRDVINIESDNMEYAIKAVDPIFNILYLLSVVDKKTSS